MAGNYGPLDKMGTAIAAATPNVPWARFGCPKIIDLDGSGTSAATPQVAAAAANWIQKNMAALQAYPFPWMRVEAVRKALFDGAQRHNDDILHFGTGQLRAAHACALVPAAAQSLRKQAPDTADHPFLNTLLGGDFGIAPSRLTAMLQLEALQLSQRSEVENEIREAASSRPSANRWRRPFATRSRPFPACPWTTPFARRAPAPASPRPRRSAACATLCSRSPTCRKRFARNWARRAGQTQAPIKSGIHAGTAASHRPLDPENADRQGESPGASRTPAPSPAGLRLRSFARGHAGHRRHQHAPRRRSLGKPASNPDLSANMSKSSTSIRQAVAVMPLSISTIITSLPKRPAAVRGQSAVSSANVLRDRDADDRMFRKRAGPLRAMGARFRRSPKPGASSGGDATPTRSKKNMCKG